MLLPQEVICKQDVDIALSVKPRPPLMRACQPGPLTRPNLIRAKVNITTTGRYLHYPCTTSFASSANTIEFS